MKVILLKDVAKVGRAYEIKEVANGYAHNFLIANNLALPATAATIRRLEHKQSQLAQADKLREEGLLKSLEKLREAKLQILAKANDEGHLFAGVHEGEISQALKKQAHLEIPPSAIVLEEPLKELGEFVVKVKTGHVTGQFTLSIERLPS